MAAGRAPTLPARQAVNRGSGKASELSRRGRENHPRGKCLPAPGARAPRADSSPTSMRNTFEVMNCALVSDDEGHVGRRRLSCPLFNYYPGESDPSRDAEATSEGPGAASPPPGGAGQGGRETSARHSKVTWNSLKK